MSVTLAYIGSRGVHNPMQMDDINTVYPYRTSGRWLFPNLWVADVSRDRRIVVGLTSNSGFPPTLAPTPPASCLGF